MISTEMTELGRKRSVIRELLNTANSAAAK